LTIPLGDGALGDGAAGLLERFHAEHDRAYGFSAPTEPAECVSLRLTTVGTIDKLPLRTLEHAGSKATSKGSRPVYFSETAGFVDCPLYDRYALLAGALVSGPAIVEELDSTVVVHPGYTVRVSEVGNLIVTRASG
jgi:N-methylhydantoinase A